MAKTQLLLLDEHVLVRVILGRLLDSVPTLHVAAECGSSAEALEALSRCHIDLVLLDYDLGAGETGFEFIHRARDTGYSGRILIVTAGMADNDYIRALGYGANGIFLKHSPPELLTEAIHKIMAGETWFDPRCVQALAEAVQRENGIAPVRPLTERERQVLSGVADGLSNKEIGVHLNISPSSVKAALQQLFNKTGTRTRSQLVRIALEKYREGIGQPR